MKTNEQWLKEFRGKHTDGFGNVDSTANAVEAFIQSILDEKDKEIERVEDEAVVKWREDLGFYDFVDFIEKVLDAIYPEDVFDGSSGDRGSVFVTEVRKSIYKLKAVERDADGNTADR
jgi:hypothetical protein